MKYTDKTDEEWNELVDNWHGDATLNNSLQEFMQLDHEQYLRFIHGIRDNNISYEDVLKLSSDTVKDVVTELVIKPQFESIMETIKHDKTWFVESEKDKTKNLKCIEEKTLNSLTKEEETEVYVKTNRGEIPLEEYLDIKAIQNGFNDYVDMKSNGIKIDINPEDIVLKNTESDSINKNIREQELINIKDDSLDSNTDNISFFVAECMEFHNLGAMYENLSSIDEAVSVYKTLPQSSSSMGNGIGVFVNDDEYHLLNNSNVDTLEYYSQEFRNNPVIINAMDKLNKEFPIKKDVSKNYIQKACSEESKKFGNINSNQINLSGMDL